MMLGGTFGRVERRGGLEMGTKAHAPEAAVQLKRISTERDLKNWTGMIRRATVVVIE